MVVSGIVGNDNYTATASRTDSPKVFKKCMKRHRVEPLLLSLEYQLPVAQSDSAKVSYALSGWMMQQHRILLLWGYPHPAPRPILLKMNFIARPEINSWIGRELSKFFYMPLEARDRLEQSKGAVYAGESQGI
jgi:hypothetical protein